MFRARSILIRSSISQKWYPETWSVGGEEVFYRPNLKGIGEGQYRSGDPIVVENHVKALDYALADISIVSCKSLKCSCRSSFRFVLLFIS